MLSEYESKLDRERYAKEKAFIHDKRNQMGRCPYCNGSIKDRKIALYKGLINSLYAVYKWCGEHKRHEFTTKDIKHLLNKNEYNRFGDLVRFGGIVYKPKLFGKSKKALYGLNMARAKEFFHGASQIPMQIVIDQITGETIEIIAKGAVKDFPELSVFINTDGLYDHETPVQEKLL